MSGVWGFINSLNPSINMHQIYSGLALHTADMAPNNKDKDPCPQGTFHLPTQMATNVNGEKGRDPLQFSSIHVMHMKHIRKHCTGGYCVTNTTKPNH